MTELTETAQIRMRLSAARTLGREIIRAIDHLCDNPEQPDFVFEIEGERITVTTEQLFDYLLKVTVAGEPGHEMERCAYPRKHTRLLIEGEFDLNSEFESLGSERNAFEFVINTF